jgi:hypothetical protein
VAILDLTTLKIRKVCPTLTGHVSRIIANERGGWVAMDDGIWHFAPADIGRTAVRSQVQPED